MDLREELDFMDTFADDNPKNYQVWYHRRAIVERLGDPYNELEFCQKVFMIDAKNYHAWAHRLVIYHLKNGFNLCFGLIKGNG